MVGRAQSAPRSSQGGCGGTWLGKDSRLVRGGGGLFSSSPFVTCQLCSGFQPLSPTAHEALPHTSPGRWKGDPELTWWGGHLLPDPRDRNPGVPHARALSGPRASRQKHTQIRTSLSLCSACISRARGALCPVGSCDLLYLLMSFLFPEPEYPPQVTEVCSAKGFYGKLQMTHENAKSGFIFKSRALSDTLSIHPSAASLRGKHLLML